jgi:phosphohistidine phosphatase
MARWLAEHDATPQLVLCSSATRARETLDLLQVDLDPAHVLVEDALYGAGSAGLLARVRALPESVEDVLLIGHNPGLADLCLLLAATGALALLESDTSSWSELGEGAMRLRELVLPRELGRG